MSSTEALDSILSRIDALSPDEMKRLRLEIDRRIEPSSEDDRLGDREVQRRLVESGLLAEIKPPVADLGPYRDRQPVPISGEPLSATVLRERR